ncbi:MAG: redox-sensing transcriptional repressor Rex [Phycisphaerales bacterium]|nr:redox-sensing transcriptional repressor Rex [Phycisphaerales bacterium]
MASVTGTGESVSAASLRRLPSYRQYLKVLQGMGREVVSCSHIGQALKLNPTQVRKDLAVTGIVGRPKVGYETEALIEAIESFLGWNNLNQAFLVGVGSMGTALLGYDQFNHYGLKIVAAFDNNPSLIGQKIHGHEVLSLDKLTDLAARMHVLVGILTVPAQAAQSVANLMIFGGIRAIWNFAPAPIEVPEGMVVQTEDLFSGFAVLSSRLAEVMGIRRKAGVNADANRR